MTTNEPQESTFISASAPVSSILTITVGNEHQGEPTKGNTHLQKQVNRRRVKSAILSPGSASSVCQSPRLKVRIKLALYLLNLMSCFSTRCYNNIWMLLMKYFFSVTVLSIMLETWIMIVKFLHQFIS